VGDAEWWSRGAGEGRRKLVGEIQEVQEEQDSARLGGDVGDAAEERQVGHVEERVQDAGSDPGDTAPFRERARVSGEVRERRCCRERGVHLEPVLMRPRRPLGVRGKETEQCTGRRWIIPDGEPPKKNKKERKIRQRSTGEYAIKNDVLRERDSGKGTSNIVNQIIHCRIFIMVFS